jgi:RNA polymerase sigma factor (sigma-70 family)
MSKKLIPEQYSLYDMSVLERCKVDSDFLGEVIIANELLIFHSIHKYIGKPEIIATNNSIDKDDILQLGRMGFVKAVKAFDTTRGIKFSSFAVTTIVREVKCYIRDSVGTIRLTRAAHILRNNIRRIENNAEQPPTISELSKMLNVSEEKISKVICVGRNVKSLDEQSSNEGWFNKSLDNTEFINNTESSGSYNTHNSIVDKIYVDSLVDSIKDRLSDVELSVVKSQLAGYTQTQTAKINNISQMRVSRIIKKTASLLSTSLD